MRREKKVLIIVILFLICAAILSASAANLPMIQWQKSLGASGMEGKQNSQMITKNSDTVSTVTAQLNSLPLSFIENKGQSDPHVRFAVKGSASTLFFTPEEIVIASGQETVVRQGFIGAAADPAIEGTDRLPGIANFLIGNDSSQWYAGVPTFGTIIYHSLYPGVDLRYTGSNGTLKREFIVAPGAVPSVITLHYVGIDSIMIDDTGALLIVADNTTLIESPPVCYQKINGGQKPVSARYNIISEHDVVFSLEKYDPNYPLVIDPSLIYSTYLGGDAPNFGSDFGSGIAIDSSGNAYITGLTQSSNFPTTTGAFQTGYTGPGYDAYVTKLNPSGTGLIYSTYLGGNSPGFGPEFGSGIAVDSSGNAYVTGFTDSNNFPTTMGSLHGYSDGFVTKLNPAGTGLVYSIYLGGDSGDQPNSIAIDSSGNAYITGFTDSNNFPTTPGVFQSTFSGTGDAFVTKVNPIGTAFVYSTYLGGSSTEGGRGISIDSGGNAFVTGFTNSNNFPTTMSSLQTVHSGGYSDGFVTKLNPAGTGLVYSTYLGGNSPDFGSGIAIDSSGNAYITGETTSNNFPTTPGVFQPIYGGGSGDAFVTKVNPTGTAPLVYSTFLGGIERDWGSGITVDNEGNAIVVGSTASSNFPVTSGAFQTQYAGSGDAFVTELNPSGTAPLLYSTYLGGGGYDEGNATAVDSDGNVYVVGTTFSSNFPVSPGAIHPSLLGSQDAFVTKLTVGDATQPPECNCPQCCCACSSSPLGSDCGENCVSLFGISINFWLAIWTLLATVLVIGIIYYIIKKTQ